jgi:monothiol glutaredoxin
VILFMKGDPEAPACGFSRQTVAVLQALDARFAAVDVLPDPRIRQELSALSNWPTIPQLFVNGELVGGCDIVTEMYESGELADLLGVENPADPGVPTPATGAVEGATDGGLQIENRLG